MDPRRDPRIVVVDLGPDPKTAIVIETLKSVAATHPKAVGLDLIFVKDLQNNRSKSGENPVDQLAKELNVPELQDTPIAMDVQSNRELMEDLRGAGNSPCFGQLRRSEDGVVRAVCPEESLKNKLPTLAEAMLQVYWGQAAVPPASYSSRPSVLPRRMTNPGSTSSPGGYVTGKPAHILNDSYVLLGEAVTGEWEAIASSPRASRHDPCPVVVDALAR